MSVDVFIRAAAERDLPAVLALYAQPDLDDGNVLQVDQAAAIFARFALYPNYTLFVAEEGQQVIGTFALLVMDNLAHRGTPSAVVEDVVVSAAHRGRGIGRAMMRFAMERCALHGCYKMALSSNLKRRQAHAFYDSLGFERHGFSFVVKP